MPMLSNISTLSKKTKVEILTEYEKLLASIEQAKQDSREVFDPVHAQEIITAQRNFTTSGVETAVLEMKTSTSEKLAEVSRKITEVLDALMQETRAEIEKFSGITQAIEFAEKRLTSLHHIEVTAASLEIVVAEYAEKKRLLETEHTTQLTELTELITKKKRDWQREEEEYEYTRKLIRTREDAEREEKQKARESALQLREHAITSAEDELNALRARIETIPFEIEKGIHSAEQEISKRLAGEHKTHIESLNATWESEKRIIELKHSHLEAQYKKLEAELVYAKKEAELAQKKAQELAMTIIEHRHTTQVVA